MKIRHRVPTNALTYRSEPVSERYQTEVDGALAGAEKRARIAQRRLHSAELQLRRVRMSKVPRPQALLVAQEIVELRRQELLDVQRQMQAVAASSVHRSRQGHRPVPQGRTL